MTINDTEPFYPTPLSSPANNDVHVWYATLTQPELHYNALAKTLSADEHKRAARFYSEQDRRRFVSSRAILRNILASYMDINPDECQFHYGKHGKPALAASHQSSLCFNVSHSGELAMYAITQNWEVGIDVEQVRPLADAQQIARRFFSQQENDHLDHMPVDHKQETFFRYWTCKEAIVKAMGDGFFHPLEQITIGTLPNKNTRLVKIAGEADANALWLLQSLTPPQGYIAALALNGQHTTQSSVRYQQWKH